MLRSLIVSIAFCISGAQAEGLKVVTDIAPVGSIVSMMTGSDVTVLIGPGSSPHDAGFNPSMARALEEADVVIWMGKAMAPGLEKPIHELATNATVLELMDIQGLAYLQAREGAAFPFADHEGKEDGAETGTKWIDPHAWLSPAIVRSWAGAIADLLIQADPPRAEGYKSGRSRAVFAALDASAEFREILKDAGLVSLEPTELMRAGRPVAALHDAFQYLEKSFGLQVLGAVRAANGLLASESGLSKLVDAIAATNAACLISDGAETDAEARSMAQTLGLRLVPLDILGAHLEQGPALYGTMMRKIAIDLKGCL